MPENENIFQDKMDLEIEKLFNDIGKDTLPNDFTTAVLENITKKTLASQFMVKPVISIRAWMFIIASLFMIILYSFTQLSSPSSFSVFFQSLDFLSKPDYLQIFAVSLSGLTKTMISSKWILWIVSFMGFGTLYLYLQQKINLE